jgi:hypothetical protein
VGSCLSTLDARNILLLLRQGEQAEEFDLITLEPIEQEQRRSENKQFHAGSVKKVLGSATHGKQIITCLLI